MELKIGEGRGFAETVASNTKISYTDKDKTSIFHIGWLMIYDYTSFSTVFKSNQNDKRLIMKGCVQRNPVYD